MEILKLIQKRDFATALSLIEPLRKVELKKIATRKVSVIGTSILFIPLFILAVLGIVAFYSSLETLESLDKIPVFGTLTISLNNILKVFFGGNPSGLLVVIFWFLTFCVMSAICSAAMGLIVPAICSVKSKSFVEGSTKSQTAENFKNCIYIKNYTADLGSYSLVLAFIMAIVTSIICLVSMQDDPMEKIAAAIIAAILTFILYFLLSSLSLKINNKVIMRFAKSNADYYSYISETDKCIEKIKEEEELERKRQLKARFDEVIKKEPIDEDEIEHLADSGCADACLYLAEKIYARCIEKPETLSESGRKNLEAKAIKYLEIPVAEENIVAKFLNIDMQMKTKYFSDEELKEFHYVLRDAEESGKLNPNYLCTCKKLLEITSAAVTRIVNMEIAIKNCKKYCKCCNAGICNYYSSSEYLAKCSYINNPSNCPTAINNKLIGYIFD